MTRRELKDAVVEAAREHTECKGGVQRMVKVDINLHRASHALDACTEPDLDALNAAVAEAVETYMVKWPHMDIKANCNEWTTIIEACRARRAALAPKPRYEARDGCHILDNTIGYLLKPEAVAALLNKEKP